MPPGLPGRYVHVYLDIHIFKRIGQANVFQLERALGRSTEPAENILLTNLKLLAQEGKMIIMITHNKESLSFCNKLIFLNGE